MISYIIERVVPRKILIMVLSTFVFSGMSGQSAYIPPEKPKLIIGIVIEQLRYDQLEKYKDKFGENGIKRLLNEGTFYKNAYYQYALTQSAPGYATISTGTEPSFHGITSDNWYLPLRNELIYCTKDGTVNPVGGSYENGLQSPLNLLSSTFSDELELSTNNQSKVYGIGLKGYSSILSTGHAGDGAYWYDGVTGTWMTSSYYMDSLPAWVNDFNALMMSESYLNGVWNLMQSKDCYLQCLPDSNEYESGFNGLTYFPYDLKKLSTIGTGILNKKRDYSLLRETPFGNSFTNEFALRLIKEEGMGSDDITDFLSINYSATDYIGHRFGPSSVEMADAILRLDKDIETLLNYLNDSIGKRNVLIYFTSAHGISEIPAVLQKNKIPSGYFQRNQAVLLLKSYLNAVYGEGDWVKGYYENQIFLNRILIEDSKIPLEEIQKKIARFLVQFSGIASAIPYSAFEANDFGNGLLKKISNGFNSQRSGDIFITLNPGWVDKDDYVTNHNSPYDYDSHVPLIWYGWSVNRTSVTRNINISDIAATLSGLCKIPLPNASTGTVLDELFR
jgi:predicted AlkP superfamily pyrophosphatase or phosphodiesterase